MSEHHDRRLGQGVRALAEPAPVDPALRRAVGTALDRRRRRRSARFAVAGAVAAVIVVAGGVAWQADRTPGSAPTATASPTATPPTAPAVDWTRGWQPIAQAPLSPRNGGVAVWTGEEMVVVGGDATAPCPPTADCYLRPQPLADGAAFDPATDTWRPIADAPIAFTRGVAAWTRTELIVVAGRTTMVYDPAGDTWRTLDDVPFRDTDPTLTVAGNLVALSSYDQGTRGDEPTDAVLDPDTGAWTVLPHDPFGESYDRSLAWDGRRWWLLSMPAEHHFKAHRGAASRVAVLEGDTWRVSDPSTPKVTYGQRWYFDGQDLVLPGTDAVPTRAFDPVSETWRELAPAVPGPCPAARIPGAPAGVEGCPDLPEPAAAVWTGAQVILWGGPDRRWRANTADGQIWTP